MSNRYISTTFWDDEWVQDLDSEGKVLYLYLLTCQSANIAGIYKISVRRMSFDTAVPEDKVRELLGQFETAGKVYRFREYVILKNWLKYQNSGNARVRTGIERIVKDLPKEVFDFCITNGLVMYDQYMTDIADSDIKSMTDTSDSDNIDISHKENTEKDISVHSDFNLDSNLDLDLNNTISSNPEEPSLSINYQFFVDSFNQTCPTLPKVHKIPEKRKKAIKSIWVEFGDQQIIQAMEKVDASDFLSGRSGSWRCSFDWLFVKGNMLKVLEGNYDNKQKNLAINPRPTQHIGSSSVWSQFTEDQNER